MTRYSLQSNENSTENEERIIESNQKERARQRNIEINGTIMRFLERKTEIEKMKKELDNFLINHQTYGPSMKLAPRTD